MHACNSGLEIDFDSEGCTLAPLQVYVATWHQTHVAVKVLLARTEGASTQGEASRVLASEVVQPRYTPLKRPTLCFASATTDCGRAITVDDELLGRLKEVGGCRAVCIVQTATCALSL